jgi:Tfp pilus assembly protein PilX
MIRNLLRSSHGTILVVAMLLMTTLAIIGIATNMNVITDTGIASNYLSSLQSFYIAEAGLERGKAECARRFITGSWSDFNALLRGNDGTAGTADDGILSFGSSVSFHGGQYSVRAVNETWDSGGSGTDTNATVTLISEGSYGKSTSTLSTTIAMNIIPSLPGSLSLVGSASTYFADDMFMVDGRDYLLSDGSTPSGKAGVRSGLSIADVPAPGLARQQVINSLSSDQIDNIGGAELNPSIGTSTNLNKALLRQSVDALRRLADNRLAEPGNDLTTSGPDNSVTIGTRQYSLGTDSSPKVTYISKADGGTLSVSGSGLGVFIIEGDNVCFKPSFNFGGLIILLGRNVVLDDSGSSKGLQLKGGLVVAELSDNAGGYDIIMTGNSRILYSQEAIDRAKQHAMRNKKVSVLSWQRSN